MRIQTYGIVLALLLATSAAAQQTIYWKKDHIYNGPGGKEIAVVTPTPSDTTAPTGPSGLASSNITATSVQLTWSGSTDSGGSGLAGYKIYRQQGTGANLPVGTVGTGTLSFTDRPLTPSASYIYTIVAFDSAQNHSTASNAVSVTTSSSAGDTTAPSIPQNLTTLVLNRTGAQLNWNASTDSGGSGLVGYRVYRGGTLISGASPIVGTSYQDTGLGYNATYSYTVSAVDNVGNASAQSSAASITTARNVVFQDNFNRADNNNLNNSDWSVNGFGIRFGTAAALYGSWSYPWYDAFYNPIAPLDFRISVDVLNSPAATGLVFWGIGNGSTYTGYRAFTDSGGGAYLAYYTDIVHGAGNSGQLLAQSPLPSGAGTLGVSAKSSTGNIQVLWNGTTGGICYSPSPADAQIYNNLDIDTTESDFVHLNTGTYFDPSTTPGSGTLTLKDGTQIGMAVWRNGNSITNSSYTPPRQWTITTTNGNRLLPNDSNIVPLPASDTVGRTITVSSNGSTDTITLQDSNGQNKVYTVNWGAIAARDPDDINNTLFTGVTSVVLPNGKSFQLQYNAKGQVSQLTYPSGAYVKYTYTNSYYPNPKGWQVVTRVVSSDGTAASEQTWTYGYGAYGTANDPTGGQIQSSFNSAGLELSRLYNDNTGTTLKRVDQSWQPQSTDSQGNPLNFQLTTETTTVGVDVRKTTYGYDSFNNVATQNDYDFAVGAAGPLLRSVVRTYLTVNPVNNVYYRHITVTKEIVNGEDGCHATTLALCYRARISHAARPIHLHVRSSEFLWAAATEL